MEWTPETLKVEAEYRQRVLRTDAHQSRLLGKRARGWWHRLANR